MNGKGDKMTLQYIMGAPSTGKTKFCTDKISILEKCRNENILFIVPEQSSLQAEKELVNRNGAIVKTQVLSFQRLSFYIFSELGTVKKNLLEDIGKNMLLRKILSELKLNFFTGITKKTGFVDNLSFVISEFYKYEITYEDLKKISAYTSGSLKIKLEDLCLIYKKYTEYIRKKYLSLDETLDMLADKICESKYLNGIKIFMDGFDSFNPQEYRVIEELMKKANTFFFAASIHINQGHGIRYKDVKITDPYFEIKNTINNLTDMAQRNNLKIAQPVSFEKVYKDNYELEFLVNNYFYIYSRTFSQPSQNIFLYCANNLYEEIDFIARKIISYVKNGLRFNNIAIVTGNLEDYSGPIERIFRLYSIPYFIDKKIEIVSNQLVDFIRSTFDVIIFNFSYESVFGFLKTNLVGIDIDDIDLIENYVLEFGIKGELWKKDWYLGFNKYDETEIIRIKNLIMEKFDFLSKNLLLHHKYKISSLCEFVFEMLTFFGVQNKLLYNPQENLKVWKKICVLFEKIVDVLGEAYVDIREFVQILDEGMGKIDLGLIPQFSDQIVIGDIDRSRIPNVKVLFIAGANDGYFYDFKDENGIINEEEKMFLNSLGLKLSNGIDYKILKSDFLLYGLISKPSYQLNISCSIKNNDEKQMYPAEIFSKIKSLFPNLSNDYSFDLTVSKAMLNDVVRIICTENRSDSQLQIYNWFRKSSAYGKKLIKFEEVFADNSMFVSKIDLNYDKLDVSVTQLERYAQCPFSYFLRYNLRLHERKVYKLKSVDIGSFLHSTLKEFFSFVKENNAFLACRENLGEYIDIAIKKCNFDIDIFYESSYYKFLLYHVKNVLNKSISAMLNNIEEEKYLPDEFEFEFSHVKLVDNIFLNGKIDRIDILNIGDEKYLRVIDYKSSDKKFSLQGIYDGTQLQLLIYLKVLSDKDIKPGGAFYFHLSDPFIDIKNEMSDLQIAHKINEKFKMHGVEHSKINELIEVACCVSKKMCDRIITGSINIMPRDKYSCLGCHYYSICRKEPNFLC